MAMATAPGLHASHACVMQTARMGFHSLSPIHPSIIAERIVWTLCMRTTIVTANGPRSGGSQLLLAWSCHW